MFPLTLIILPPHRFWQLMVRSNSHLVGLILCVATVEVVGIKAEEVALVVVGLTVDSRLTGPLHTHLVGLWVTPSHCSCCDVPTSFLWPTAQPKYIGLACICQTQQCSKLASLFFWFTHYHNSSPIGFRHSFSSPKPTIWVWSAHYFPLNVQCNVFFGFRQRRMVYGYRGHLTSPFQCNYSLFYFW